MICPSLSNLLLIHDLFLPPLLLLNHPMLFPLLHICILLRSLGTHIIQQELPLHTWYHLSSISWLTTLLNKCPFREPRMLPSSMGRSLLFSLNSSRMLTFWRLLLVSMMPRRFVVPCGTWISIRLRSDRQGPLCYASRQTYVEVNDTYSEGGTHEETLRPQSKARVMNKR